MKLLSTDNSKLEKGRSLGYETYGLSLAPATLAGGPSVCPNASPACKEACLFYAGMGVFSNVQKARIEKTRLFFRDKAAFIETLKGEISLAVKRAERNGLKPAFRLNVLSDIHWEKHGIFEEFPDTAFYDYSKNQKRILQFLNGELPENYHLTFSRSETNEKQSLEILEKGGNVAAVFRRELPKEWNGFDVISGDVSDLRFLDPRGVVVGLIAKGKGKADKSGFVLD